MKLKAKCITTEAVIDTKLVELTVKPRNNKEFETFKVSSYLKESLNVRASVINITAL